MASYHRRSNDISYYEVKRPDQTLSKPQGSGYSHCIPRSLVSAGEKVLFSETLQTLDLDCARAGAAGLAVGLSAAAADVPRAIAAAGKAPPATARVAHSTKSQPFEEAALS